MPGPRLLYRPAVLGVARLHYADKKAGMDHWQTLGLLRPVVKELPADVWSGAEAHTDHVPELNKAPEPGARFDPLPGAGEGQVVCRLCQGSEELPLSRAQADCLVVPGSQGVLPS